MASWAAITLRLSPFGHGQEDVGALRAGLAQDVLVRPVAANGLPAERRRQPVERRGDGVEDDHLVSGAVVQIGGRGADPAASDDDDLHVRLLVHRVAHHPDRARRVLEDVRDGAADGELATEPLAIGQADDEQVRPALDRLVDDGRADVAGLEQDRLEPDLRLLGDRLGDVEDALDLVRVAGDVGIEWQRPVDLDDVDRDQLGLVQAGLLGDEPNDPGIARAAVEGDDGTAKRRRVGF